MRKIANLNRRWLVLFCLLSLLAGFMFVFSPTPPSQLPIIPSGEWRAMDNGQAATPPMGWSSWTAFKLDIDQEKLENIAEALVSTGLRDAGYVQLNIDDGWWLQRRSSDGRLLVNTNIFPGAKLPSGENSFRPFTDYLHRMGLKAGMYSDAGRNSCSSFWDRKHPNLPRGSVDEREVGTWDYTREDLALFFDEWGFDYLKLDACGISGKYMPLHLLIRGLPGQFRSFPRLPDELIRARYAQVGRQLAETGRDVTYSVCVWGEANVNHWGAEVGNLWRTSLDITPEWKVMLRNYESAVDQELYAGPGRWNDPDIMEVGLGDFSAAHIEQARSHFSLWAMLSAPLILGNDLADMHPDILELISHPDVIAINQDPAGHQARRVFENGEYDVLVKTLSAPFGETRRALLVLNRQGDEMTVRVPLEYTQLASASWIRDTWTGESLEPGGQDIELTVPARGVRLLEIEGEHRLRGQRYLTELPGQVHIAQSHSRTARVLDTTEVEGLGVEQALAMHPNTMLQWRVPANAENLSLRFSADKLAGDNRLALGVFGDGQLLSRHILSPGDAAPVAISHDLASIRLLEITVESTADHGEVRALLLNPTIAYSHEP